MLVAGIMSGTSVDGIDVALVEIVGQGFDLEIKPVGFRESPFPDCVREEILAVSDATVAMSRISQLNFLLGRLFGEAVLQACEHAGLQVSDLDLIGSHGQTIYHQGCASGLCGFEIASTMQIGEPACIARIAGAPVVADFRPADMAAGGSGAPLVPFADYLLFRHRERSRVALNIGGIANLSAIPAGAGPEEVLAFDTGPGNMVIDHLVQAITGGAKRFDRDGRMASRGSADEELLATLLEDPYYSRPPPKSAGREQFGAWFATRLQERIAAGNDLVATAAELTVRAILLAVERFVRPRMPVDELVVSGGGRRNPAILRPLRERLRGTRVRGSGELGIDPDAKEAVAFAILAHEAFHRRPANLPSATGASGPAVLGKIVYG